MIVQIQDHEEPIEAPPGRDPWGRNARDEVWDGVYTIMPDPNDEHQQIVTRFATAFGVSIEFSGLGDVRVGGNTSDRDRGWTRNYRIPDLSVFLKDTKAINQGTHWQGGPDFAVEVLSEDDHAREKIPFYSANGVQELLIVDRDPWALELYRSVAGELRFMGKSTIDAPEILESGLLPLSFQLARAEPRPRIEIVHRAGLGNWSV